MLLALCATMVWGAWAVQRQDALAQKMIRLHVIANSDSDADQTLKLQVRDKVLDYTTGILQRAEDMEDAQTQLRDALGRIENIARRAICAKSRRGSAMTSSRCCPRAVLFRPSSVCCGGRGH